MHIHNNWQHIKTVLAAITLLALSAPHALAEEKLVALRAGAAAVDITPREFPLNMPGGFNANMAESAHDPLYTRAVVFDDGTTTLAMVVVDSLGASPEVLDEAKEIAAKKTGIATDKMLICSTHTHSGPPSNTKEGSAPAVAYRKVLVAGLAESIVRARAALRPAAVGAASHPLPEEVFNRRWFLTPGKMPLNPFGKLDQVKMNPSRSPDVLDRPAGPTDPDITIISVQDERRRPLALFANYSLHDVGAPPREPFEQIRIVARKAADTAWLAHRKIEKHQSEARLGMIERKVTLKYRRPSAGEIAEASEVLAVKHRTGNNCPIWP